MADQFIVSDPTLGDKAWRTKATFTSAELLAWVTDETGSGTLVFNTAPTFSGAVTMGTSGGLSIQNNTGISTPIFDMSNSVDANLHIRITAGGSSPKFARIAPNTDTELHLGQNNTDVIYIRDTGKVEIGPGDTGTGITRIRHGRAVLVGGTVTVNDANVTANSDIQLTSQIDGGTPGTLRISARTPSTSFTITSSSGADTSTVGWLLIEP